MHCRLRNACWRLLGINTCTQIRRVSTITAQLQTKIKSPPPPPLPSPSHWLDLLLRHCRPLQDAFTDALDFLPELRHGAAAAKGSRSRMEDRHRIETMPELRAFGGGKLQRAAQSDAQPQQLPPAFYAVRQPACRPDSPHLSVSSASSSFLIVDTSWFSVPGARSSMR